MPLLSLRARADFLKARRGASFSAKTFKANILFDERPRKPVLEPTSGVQFYAGYTVTKKLFKRAVDRNRCKRRLRALMLDLSKDLDQGGHQGTIIVTLLARQGALNQPFEVLRKDAKNLKAHLGGFKHKGEKIF